MDLTKTSFIISAASIKQFPEDIGSEIAFAGRSNAGKSSALNTITRPGLAKTSKTPGRTQLINFFLVEKNLRLVDLPGYGFAKVPKTMQEHWQNLIADYFEIRQSIKGLVILMDIRHPLKEMDFQLLEYANSKNITSHILLTKSDKLSKGAAHNTLNEVKKTLATHFAVETLPTIQLFSSLKKSGIDELKKWMKERFTH